MQTTSEGKAAAKITEELTLNEFPEKINFAAKNVEQMSFGPGSQAIDAILTNGGLGLVNEVYSDFISSPRDGFGG